MTLRLYTLILIACVALATLFIRIPLPTGGYFNFGDVAVVFCGLCLGHSTKKHEYLYGAAVGSVGSALADILSGYAFFAPITFIAKGLEGGLAAYSSNYGRVFQFIVLLIGASLMVATYFIGEWWLPSIGLQGAITEVIPNIVQGGGGVVGGTILFYAFRTMVGQGLGIKQ